MTAKMVQKRCVVCGKVRAYRPRERRCKRLAGIGQWRYCWGKLERVAPPAPKPKPKPEAQTPQQVAAAKAAHADKMVAAKVTALVRLAAQVDGWRKKSERYHKLAARSDAELAAARARRQAAAEARAKARVRRAIKLAGGVT